MAAVDINSSVLKSFVKAWMREHANKYIDQCDELNITLLAEHAAYEFDLYLNTPDATIPEWVFDMSFDVDIIRKEYA